MVTFNLQTAGGWDALGAAWRVAASNVDAACEIHSEREQSAHDEAQAIGGPGDADTFEAQRARNAAIDAIKARHGVPDADELQRAALDVEGALMGEALSHRAPTLAAFMLKLDMVSARDNWGFNNFDQDTWPLFLADVRRFALLKTSQKKEARQ